MAAVRKLKEEKKETKGWRDDEQHTRNSNAVENAFIFSLFMTFLFFICVILLYVPLCLLLISLPPMKICWWKYLKMHITLTCRRASANAQTHTHGMHPCSRSVCSIGNQVQFGFFKFSVLFARAFFLRFFF